MECITREMGCLAILPAYVVCVTPDTSTSYFIRIRKLGCLFPPRRLFVTGVIYSLLAARNEEGGARKQP